MSGLSVGGVIRLYRSYRLVVHDLRELCHGARNVDGLRAVSGAETAADAVGRLACGLDGVYRLAGAARTIHLEGIVDGEERRDIDRLRTVITAIAASRAGNLQVIVEFLTGLHQSGLVLCGKSALGLEGLHVVNDLIHGGHAAENDLYAVKTLQPAECPACDAPIGMLCLEDSLCLRSKGRKASAADRLHDNYRNITGMYRLILSLGGAVLPVEVVELELAELPIGVVRELLEVLHLCVGGEAQMLDASGLLLLDEVLDAAAVYVLLPSVVKNSVDEVEINVVSLELRKLLLKDCLVIGVCEDEVLGSELIALTRTLFHGLAEELLTLSAVVGICGIKIGNAVSHGVVDYRLRLLAVDWSSLPYGRQTHVAHAEDRDVFALILSVDHSDLSFLPLSGFIRLV